MSEFISEAVYRVAELAELLGATPLNKHAGCWEHQIDEEWWVAINAHGDSHRCSTGTQVPPCMMYVQFNGWPAGFVSPRGGEFAAGSLANENSFIEAVQNAKKAVA